MTNIDNSTQTPPAYWFGVIEDRLHQRMRTALSDLGLRRGSWRILHTLADGPATAEQLAERLPHGRPGRPEAVRRPQREDHRQCAGHHHPHPGSHAEHGPEAAFERGFLRGFERGRGQGPFGGGHPGHPFAEGHRPGFEGHRPGFEGHRPGFEGHHAGFEGHRPAFDRSHRRGHRIDRVLSDFVERGWVWFDGDRATLTDEGRAAHDRASERIRSVRADLAAGIPEEDYATTLATLERMAKNLGLRPDEKDRPAEATGDAPTMDA
ncbi:hypothetical protein [Leifsonia sp. SIMBA_070]|uniref:hypothetical protein n=1 Tax=Leifsonia sp. SIMBA_070 TaxID=3085810 RepID=UPI0039789498